MAFCTKCGGPLPEAAVFCPSCGARQDGPPPLPPRGVSGDERRELLQKHLVWVAGKGARIESQGDYSAQVVQGHRVNHLLHFFIGLFTCGLWWITWVIIGLGGGERRTTVAVDENGGVTYLGALGPPRDGNETILAMRRKDWRLAAIIIAVIIAVLVFGAR